MLSNYEVKRIRDNKETDRLAQEERDNNKIKVEAETKQEKESQERSAQFVNNVIFISVITLGIVLGASLLILFVQML